MVNDMSEQTVQTRPKHRIPDDTGDRYFDPDTATRRGGRGSDASGSARETREYAPRPSTGLGAALRRYPLVALLPVVVLVAAGITLGLRKPPTYTATTQLHVGSADINSQATPGYVQAEQTLAQAYSREVTSQYVYNPAAQTMGLSPAAVAGRLSSSAVPNSPTFTINATGPSPRSAMELAAAATTALKHKINQLDQGENASTNLLNQFRQAQGQADRLQAISGALQAAHSSGAGGVSQAKVETAKLDAQVSRLRAQALGTQYTNASTMSRGAIIDVLNPATSATSNRSSIAERYALVGVAAGLVMGAALALLIYSIRRPWTDRRP
jgi:Chain length determinant protein